MQVDYDSFLTQIYNYSPYFGKERYEKEFATPYYLNALKNIHGKILELGTCTGLLTVPLGKEGHNVDSVDVSSYMHQYVKDILYNNASDISGKIQLYTCDVFDYTNTSEYAAIVMPDSFLLAQADKAKQQKLLRKCNLFLEMGGVLVFDVFKPWDDIIDAGNVQQCSRFRLPSGEVFIVLTDHVVDAEKQIHTFNFIHTLYQNRNIKYYHKIQYRYMKEDELKKMLIECGFDIIYFDENFNYGKYYAVIARKRMKNGNNAER